MAEHEDHKINSDVDRKLTAEEVFSFFKSLAQCVINHGGMTVGDVEAMTLDETDSHNEDVLHGWWKSGLEDARFAYDTIDLPLRRARARGDAIGEDES